MQAEATRSHENGILESPSVECGGTDVARPFPAISRWLFAGVLMGGLAVALGAFGAHGLASASEAWPEEGRRQRLENWEVGARYQMYHALALVAVAFHLTLLPQRRLHLAAALFLVGTIIFSGCLYAYTLSGVRLWGAVVPIGGSMLILGWGLWCFAALRQGKMQL